MTTLLRTEDDFPVIQGHWIPHLEHGFHNTRIISFYQRMDDIGKQEKIMAQIVFSTDQQCLSWVRDVFLAMVQVTQTIEELKNER